MAAYQKDPNDLSKSVSRPRVVEHALGDLDLNNNLSAKLKNPLAGISREVLLADVEAFAQEKELEHCLPQLKRGALLAQNPNGFEGLTDLTEDDKYHLRREITNKWAQPMTLYLTIALCSIGAAVQGWDQTGSNGANLSFPREFGIGSGSLADEWIIGVVNAGPYIGSAALGCWLSDPLNRMFGRRGCIFITALILIATPIGSGFTQSWQTLFVVRLIMGIGMGAKGSTVPVLAAENAPTAIRGALTMSWQLWTAFGIFLGFAANVVCIQFGGVDTWRYQLGSAFIPAVPLLAIYMVPESPRWLLRANKYPQAYKSLCRLRNSEIQAARDIYYIHVQLELEKQVLHGANFFTRFGELFTIPRVKRATLASGVVMLAQQMCGINIIAFYSSTIFRESGFTDMEALYASLGFGAVNFLFAFPALFTIDTFGRRSLLLFTFPQMAWTLLAAGLCFLISEGTGRLAGVATFIYLFAAFYSVGEGPVPFAYSAEVFPLSHREVGMAWAVTVCLGFAAVLGITFPAMLAAMGSVGAFCFYAGLNVIALGLIFFFLPETKQRSLEELDQIFSVPVSTFAKYQTGTWLPWFIKRWVFFKKDAHLQPLYQTSEMDDLHDSQGRDSPAEKHSEKDRV